MDLPQQENKMTTIGLLKSKDIEFTSLTFKDGQDHEIVKGRLVVEFIEEDNKVNNITINVFQNRYSKAGKELPSYKSALKLKDMKTIDDDGRDEADRIMVNGGIELNIYTDKEGEVHKNTQLSGSFFKAVDKDNDKYTDGANARLTLTVLGYKEEVKNQEPTGNVLLNALNIGFGNSVNQFEDLVLNRDYFGDAIEDITEIYPKGTTGYFEIKINNRVTVEKNSKEAHGFGKKLPSTATRYERSNEITYIASEPYEDNNKEVLNEKEIVASLELLKVNASSNSVSKPATKSKGGFGKANKDPFDDVIDVDDDMVPF